MKKTIYTSIITFFITSAVIASTGIHTYLPTTNNKPQTIITKPYIGTYYIGETTVNNYIDNFLNKKGIDKKSSDYEFSYGIMKNLFNLDQNKSNSIIGNFTYTLTDDKLIINDEDESQIVEWNYKIKDNILYANVYGSDEMAIGKFVENSKYLEVTSPELDNNTKILLQRSLV